MCWFEQALASSGFHFQFNDHLGYIHSCPTNCGTGMRASVHVKLPLLSKTPEFKELCSRLRLQARGEHGEHSDDSSGVYDISNKERLGKTEVELVQTMIDGVRTLIEKETELRGGAKYVAMCGRVCASACLRVSDRAGLCRGSPVAGMPVFPPGTKSLLSKYLTPEVWAACKDRVTPGGITFDVSVDVWGASVWMLTAVGCVCVCFAQNAIRSGVENVDSGVGVYAGDEDVYTVFAPLLDRVIEDYHRFPPVSVWCVEVTMCSQCLNVCLPLCCVLARVLYCSIRAACTCRTWTSRSCTARWTRRASLSSRRASAWVVTSAGSG